MSPPAPTRPDSPLRRGRPRFQQEPQPVQALVARLLEPGLAVLVFVVVSWGFGVPANAQGLILCLLVFGLSFPGRDRFALTPLRAAAAVLASWLPVLGLLALVGHATRSLSLFDTPVLVLWAVATPLVHVAALVLGRRWLQHRALQPRHRSVVVIGAGRPAAQLARALRARADLGRHLLGHFDDRGAARAPGLPGPAHDADVGTEPSADATVDAITDAEPTAGPDAGPRLGGLADAAAYVRRHGVNEVHITLPLGHQARMRALLAQLQNSTASIYVVPDVSGVAVIQGRLQQLEGIPLVGISDTPFTGTDRLVKRASDIVLASVILLLIWPLLLAVAAGVRASSPGPVIFRQRRHGLDGREIVVYKFRSMRVTEDGPQLRQAQRQDPRLTGFGAFIRRTSLDELPQFVNVLQGRMSVVGPRPHALAHNEHYQQVVQAYMARHKVKPGITGWAQVHGHRGETDTVEKMQTRVAYDLDYLRHWSLALDLRIVLRTVRLVFSDDAAF